MRQIKHLVLPDAHAMHGQDMRRFDWLANIILDERPDVVVCLGDFADMESLSSYDKGKKGFEGRRYTKDITAAQLAMDRLMTPLKKVRSRYKPRLVLTLGNHEERILRATSMQAELDGTLKIEDLGYQDHGWEVHPFLEPVEINGILYAHYFVSGIMGRAVSGEYPAATLIKKQYQSCTAGHSHLADWAQRTTGSGHHIMGCYAGCYFEQSVDWAPPLVSDMWWRGIVIKTNVDKGVYDPHFKSMNTIKRTYLKPEGKVKKRTLDDTALSAIRRKYKP